jgi:hypothetical protein
MTDETTVDLLNTLNELRRIMMVEMGKATDRPNLGFTYAAFNRYVANPETKDLFGKICDVAAKLRARGVNVPKEFPETKQN